MTGRPEMTITVYHGLKTTKQQQKQQLFYRETDALGQSF